MRAFCSLVLLIVGCSGFPQSAQMNEQLAKAAVYRIVRYSGLRPNFIVRGNPEVATAIAFIKGRKRYVEYNPAVVAGIMDSTRTDWSAVSILAHEIAHHLLGHTLEPNKLHPGDELACDMYSGFILRAMGATLDESLAAMRMVGHPGGTQRHPPKEARLQAIRAGWQESDCIQTGQALIDVVEPEIFSFSITLEGDANTYYVNARNEIVWFNDMAQAIVLGAFEPIEEKSYRYRIRWNEEDLLVDGRNVIWKVSEHQVHTPLGELQPLLKR